MKKNKRYVTQLSAHDLDELADAANIHAGEGIVIERTEEGIEVSVDRSQLSRWVKRIINGQPI